MTVTYRSSRREVAALYAYLWRRSHRLKVNQAFIAAGAYVIARAAQASAPVALGAAVVVLALLPLYPLIMFKPQERRLTIDEHGVTSSIGGRRGSVPWGKVSEVVRRGETITIVGKSLNAFVVPRRAFPTPERFDAFEAAARDWCRRAHA